MQGQAGAASQDSSRATAWADKNPNKSLTRASQTLLCAYMYLTWYYATVLHLSLTFAVGAQSTHLPRLLPGSENDHVR
jgi:hypothetical protein